MMPTRPGTRRRRPARHRRRWVRLDNASNIFLAARSDVDTKVFRMSAELDHEVDPELLQEALEATFARFPLYHAVLRRGVFWYYLQDSDLQPVVEEETEPSCAPISGGPPHPVPGAAPPPPPQPRGVPRPLRRHRALWFLTAC